MRGVEVLALRWLFNIIIINLRNIPLAVNVYLFTETDLIEPAIRKIQQQKYTYMWNSVLESITLTWMAVRLVCSVSIITLKHYLSSQQ